MSTSPGVIRGSRDYGSPGTESIEAAHVAYGSFASFRVSAAHFRSSPESRHLLALQYLSQRANNGLVRCTKERPIRSPRRRRATSPFPAPNVPINFRRLFAGLPSLSLQRMPGLPAPVTDQPAVLDDNRCQVGLRLLFSIQTPSCFPFCQRMSLTPLPV